MKKNPRSKIDKNRKYTYEEMREEALKLYAQKMDETLFEIVCVISCIVTHIMEDTQWELTNENTKTISEDRIVYKHSMKDIAVFHEELEKYIDDWCNGEFTTIDIRDVYKAIYASCRKYLKKTRRSLAE